MKVKFNFNKASNLARLIFQVVLLLLIQQVFGQQATDKCTCDGTIITGEAKQFLKGSSMLEWKNRAMKKELYQNALDDAISKSSFTNTFYAGISDKEYNGFPLLGQRDRLEAKTFTYKSSNYKILDSPKFISEELGNGRVWKCTVKICDGGKNIYQPAKVKINLPTKSPVFSAIVEQLNKQGKFEFFGDTNSTNAIRDTLPRDKNYDFILKINISSDSSSKEETKAVFVVVNLYWNNEQIPVIFSSFIIVKSKKGTISIASSLQNYFMNNDEVIKNICEKIVLYQFKKTDIIVSPTTLTGR